MAEQDYSAFQDKEGQTAGESFKRLNDLVVAVQEEEKKCEELASDLKKAQERLRDLTWRQIPELMDEMGMEEFKHKSGLKIAVKEEIETGISEDHRPDAHKWLDDNGHSGLLKRDVTVSFSKNQEKDANALASELSGKFAAVTTNMKVHPSTLKAWVKEMLGEGKAVPLDLFGVFRRRVAKVTPPPAPKKPKRA